MKRYLLLWLILPVIAVANGILREIFFSPNMSYSVAHSLSVFTGIIFFGIVFWFAMKRWPLDSPREAIKIGVIWVALMIAFEFTLGFATGRSFVELIAAYNIFSGDLWLLLVIWVGISPWLFNKILLKRKIGA